MHHLPIRAFNYQGIREARDLLQVARNDPHQITRAKIDNLLMEETKTNELECSVLIQRPKRIGKGKSRTIGPVLKSRRDVAVYLNPIIEKLTEFKDIRFDPGVWSWLGMFLLYETVPLNSNNFIDINDTKHERFVVDIDRPRLLQHHYLWRSWWLLRVHPGADFLLDQRLVTRDRIARAIFDYPRIFNSTGVVDLILRLYTTDKGIKSNINRGPGGLDHLLRSLLQYGRIYDVYGMTADDLLCILPSEFLEWDT